MKLMKTFSVLALLALASTTHANPASFSEMSDVGPAEKSTDRAQKAIPSFYLDQAAFEAAAPGLVSEDFSGAIAAPGEVVGCGNPVTQGNPCFTTVGLADGLVIATDNGEIVALGAGLLGTTTPSLAADLFASSTIVEFANPNVHAVGLNLGIESGSDDLQVTIEGPGGLPLGGTTTPISDSISFWGVVSYTPISRIILTSLNRRGEIVDTIQFGHASVDNPAEDFENGEVSDAWTLAGIGHANQGEYRVVMDEGNRELALTSDGATAYLGSDNAGFLYQQVTGDFRIESDLDTSTMVTGKAWRKAGLMVRASHDKDDIRLLMMHAPLQGRLQMVAREVYGGPGNVKVALEESTPSSLRIAIERVGQVLSVEYSLDGGLTWITPSTGLGGSIEIPSLPPMLMVGMATVSNNISVTSTALFDNVLLHQAP